MLSILLNSFVLYHELGHALIDLLHLDYAGREEDVADQVATSMILGLPPANAKLVLSGVLWFFEKRDSIISDDVLADEHLLDKQRYYNVMCWAYGRDTQEYAYLKSSLRGRADRCGEEDKKMAGGLLALFGPHFNSAALNDFYRERGIDVQHEVPGSNPPPRHPPPPPPPPQPTTATPMQFELQIGPRYIHPTYTAFAMIFDGLQLLVTLPGSSSTDRWKLFDLPESQWGPLEGVDGSRLPIAVMRIGNRLFAQWLQ